MCNLCVYSNSRNDVPRVTQRYGTIATHTRHCASVLVMFVVFCMHMHSFAGLIRRTPPPTFSDTAVTSDTTIYQLRDHWVRISWSIGSEKSYGNVPPVEVEPYPLGQALLQNLPMCNHCAVQYIYLAICVYIHA